MAITVNWPTGVITIPKADLTLVSGTLYELDTDWLRLQLKDLEDDAAGMPWPDTHRHNTEVTVAGVTFARTFEIINGYSIQFEDGAYSVRLVGSNNNLFDVEAGILVQNQVQVIPGNSAGLITKETGTSGLTAQESAELSLIRKLIDADRVLVDGDTGNMQWIDADDGVTVLRTKSVKNKAGGAIVMPDDAPAEERRD